MDTISVLVGFLVGVVVAAIAVELGLKKLFSPPSNTKVTSSWRLDEFEAPLVVALDAASTSYPPGSEVVTAGGVDPQGFRGRTFRRNPNARANVVIDRARDRALLFMGPVEPGTLALATVDRDLVGRLRGEHRRLWETGSEYVEEMPLGEVVGRHGVSVRTRGRVQEIVPYRERHLMRLTDGKQVLGVLVDAPLDLVQQDVVVTGRLIRGTSGYTVLDADEVRLVRRSKGPDRQEREVAMPVPGTPERAPAPGVAPSEPPAAPSTERVVRVPRNPTPTESPAPPEAPEMEFEAHDESPIVSEAERRKARTRVVLHR